MTRNRGKDVAPASAGGWRLLVVYRGKHCPLCKQYLTKLDAMQEDFAKLGLRASKHRSVG